MTSLKRFSLAFFLLITLLFCYFRVKPIYFQTVPFTYDQGRDFLKASELITRGEIPFIGPTTGVGGLFHGAWWYYFLGLAYLIFQGFPQGFYLAVFLVQLACFVAFSVFIKRHFGWLITIILALLITVSPYFMSTSMIIANNSLTIPFLLSFLMLTINLLHTKNKRPQKILLALGLSIGLITETELAFGALLVPTFILLALLIKDLRRYFSQKEHILLVAGGFLIPVIPRILFEIKNLFPQIRAVGRFILLDGTHTPKQYSSILQDRLNTFFEYYRSIFPDNLVLFVFTSFFIVIAIASLLGVVKKQSEKRSVMAMFAALLLLILFFFSTLYNDTFWPYYLEGFQYVLLLIFAYALSLSLVNRPYITRTIHILMLAVLVVTAVRMFVRDVNAKPSLDGLKVQKDIVGYITYEERHNLNDYCVLIYTAPVIPHTYNYLFSYNEKQGIPQPKREWKKGECWVIVEDDLETRRSQWRQSNIPADATLLKETVIKDAHVELWKK